MTKSLTIVLPIHNGESRLRNHVSEMLELASELTPNFKILIVDDGSTDATFEVAEDLAARYPQVAVRRHRHRCGIGSALDYVQRNVRTDAVIFHDGVTPIDCSQMRSVWYRWVAQMTSEKFGSVPLNLQPHDICDFANLPAIHAAMERAHAQLLGFQLVVPRQTGTEFPNDDNYLVATGEPRADAAHVLRQSGVGRIPRMPKPKFASVIAEFALGE